MSPRKPPPLRLLGSAAVLRCDTNIDGKRTIYPAGILWTSSRKTIDTRAIRAWCDRADAWLASEGKRGAK